MKPLSKGDTCKVRLHTGEVVDAEYDVVCHIGDKEHWVKTKEMGYMVAGADFPDKEIHVRFVGPACEWTAAFVNGATVDRIKAIIADDSLAITFQTMGQYRSHLIKLLSNP